MQPVRGTEDWSVQPVRGTEDCRVQPVRGTEDIVGFGLVKSVTC